MASPQVIQTNSGARRFQALLAGGQAIGQGLGQLGEAIASMRERARRIQDEDVARDLVKRYGAYATTPKTIGESGGTVMPTEADRTKYMLRLLAEDGGSIRAQSMAGQVIEQFDPMVGGKLAIQNAIDARQEARLEAESKRAGASYKLAEERLELQKAKYDESRKSMAESVRITQSVNDLMRSNMHPQQRLEALNALLGSSETSALQDGAPLIDTAARKLLTEATESTADELVSLYEAQAEERWADKSAEASVSEVMRAMEQPGFPPYARLALAKVAAKLRAKISGDKTGYSALIGAMSMAMRNSGNPVLFQFPKGVQPVGVEVQIYQWLTKDPSFSSLLTAKVEAQDQASKNDASARLAASINSRLAGPALAEQQQMFSMLGTSPAKPIAAMFSGAQNPDAQKEFIENLTKIHKGILANQKKASSAK